MILTALLAGIATGTAAGAALIWAWTTGALDDARTRTAFLQEQLDEAREELNVARLRERTLAERADIDVEQVLADARPAPRGRHHRKATHG